MTRLRKQSTAVTTPQASAKQRRPETGNERRTALIAEAAYFRAEKRGFVPGRELEDWLAAEREIDDRQI